MRFYDMLQFGNYLEFGVPDIAHKYPNSGISREYSVCCYARIRVVNPTSRTQFDYHQETMPEYIIQAELLLKCYFEKAAK